MPKKITWIKNGSTFTRAEGEVSALPKLPKAIYTINFNPMAGWSIEHFADKFEFGYKIYGLQEEFIKYIINTWENTTGNLGILLNGIRGTGKTVTAKILCNTIPDLPVILVKNMGNYNQDMIEYIGAFNFDCILLIDEFEKEFSKEDSTILQLMDGVYTSGHRKLCLLTTNTLSVNENLLDRPTRVRYVKKFGNIDLKSATEYLEDNLNDKSLINEIISYTDTLKISTIDILKMIVEEINIHGIDEFRRSKNFLNISTNDYSYRTICCSIDGGGEGLKKVQDYCKEKGWALKDFFKAVLMTKKDPMYSPYIKDEDNVTKAEKEKLEKYQEWCALRSELQRMCITYPSYDTIETERKINNYKVGDIFIQRIDDYDPEDSYVEKIIYLEKDFIISQQEYNDGRVYLNGYIIESYSQGSIYGTGGPGAIVNVL